MSKFKKEGGKKLPGISTASLPDIIFMLLFFFMVTTVMREVELKVTVKAPDASEVQKLEDKSLVSPIYIGKPTKVLQQKWGDEDRIQLNDAFAEVGEIRSYVEEKLTKIPEYKRKRHIVSMKVDADAKMGIVTDVKQELRKANALKINYSTRKGFNADKN
jgi:biopolymer transport protein ExbD